MNKFLLYFVSGVALMNASAFAMDPEVILGVPHHVNSRLQNNKVEEIKAAVMSHVEKQAELELASPKNFVWELAHFTPQKIEEQITFLNSAIAQKKEAFEKKLTQCINKLKGGWDEWNKRQLIMFPEEREFLEGLIEDQEQTGSSPYQISIIKEQAYMSYVNEEIIMAEEVAYYRPFLQSNSLVQDLINLKVGLELNKKGIKLRQDYLGKNQSERLGANNEPQ